MPLLGTKPERGSWQLTDSDLPQHLTHEFSRSRWVKYLTYNRQAELFVGFGHVQSFHAQVDVDPEISDAVAR